MSETEFESYASKLAIDFAGWVTETCANLGEGGWIFMEEEEDNFYSMETLFEKYRKIEGL